MTLIARTFWPYEDVVVVVAGDVVVVAVVVAGDVVVVAVVAVDL